MLGRLVFEFHCVTVKETKLLKYLLLSIYLSIAAREKYKRIEEMLEII